MASICYKWNDAPYFWSNAPFTWAEACVIEKLVDFGGGGGIQSRIRTRAKKLSDEERKIIINLFLRLEVDEIVFEKRINKQKNTKVKIKLKDIEVKEKVQKNIKVNIKLD